MSNVATENCVSDVHITVTDLPVIFKVKYIGQEIARGLWGIKYTRRPVDLLVDAAKSLPSNKSLPLCELKVSKDNVKITTILPKINPKNWCHPIETISYGVQDLVYTRVFAMIVVKDDIENPFEVHAFVCDSRAIARRLTFALAAAFQDYSRRVKDIDVSPKESVIIPVRRKFAIDLRSAEEMRDDVADETEA